MFYNSVFMLTTTQQLSCTYSTQSISWTSPTFISKPQRVNWGDWDHFNLAM